MFDGLPALTLTDRLGDAIYRWRGIAEWPEAEATVFSCEWITDHENGGGCYTVTFNYRARGNIQSGSFTSNAPEHASPYFRGDTFTLRYNPKRPSRFYYPTERSQFWGIKATVFSLLLGFALAIILIAAY